MAVFKMATIKNGSKDGQEYLVTIADADDKSYGFMYERGMVKLHKRTNVGTHGRVEEYDKVFVDARELDFIEGSEFEK